MLYLYGPSFFALLDFSVSICYNKTKSGPVSRAAFSIPIDTKDPLIKVKPKIEEGVILGWLKKEYNNSSHRH